MKTSSLKRICSIFIAKNSIGVLDTSYIEITIPSANDIIKEAFDETGYAIRQAAEQQAYKKKAIIKKS